ncbi:MAG: hypothetical protein JWO53_710 [Chlamydiia bacterium]|nr:hypothetical protein [Chlamydiia bacterium]
MRIYCESDLFFYYLLKIKFGILLLTVLLERKMPIPKVE